VPQPHAIRIHDIRLALVGDLLDITLEQVSLNFSAVDAFGLPNARSDDHAANSIAKCRAFLLKVEPPPGKCAFAQRDEGLGIRLPDDIQIG
jgi:hypothetical protein